MATKRTTALLINIVLTGLLLSRCQNTSESDNFTTGTIQPTLAPATYTSTPFSKSTIPALQPTPTSMPVPAWAANLPFPLSQTTCSKPDEIKEASFTMDGQLIISAGRHDEGTYGIYRLNKWQAKPQLLILEKNWIGKLIITPDYQWMIYSTYSSGATEPSDWVMASVSGEIVKRVAWEGLYTAYDWGLFNCVADNIEVARIPNQIIDDGFREFSILLFPSGENRSFPLQADLPDFTNGPVIAPATISVDPFWTRALYHSLNISSGNRGMVLRNLEKNTTLWEVHDDNRIIGSGYGFSWPWAPNGNFVALTFSPRDQIDTDRQQGELFVLDRDGSSFLQISDFAEIYSGDYYASPGPWSPNNQELGFTLYAYGSSHPPEFYVADFTTQQIIDSCYEGDPFGVWSSDGRYFATNVIANGSDRLLLTVDILRGETQQVATEVHAVYAWLP